MDSFRGGYNDWKGYVSREGMLELVDSKRWWFEAGTYFQTGRGTCPFPLLDILHSLYLVTACDMHMT